MVAVLLCCLFFVCCGVNGKCCGSCGRCVGCSD